MGIEIEFISSEVLKDKEGEARMKYIRRRIKKDKILVIDGSLTALEETMLIEKTMSAIDDKFKGIEISTLRGKTEGSIKNKLIKLLGGKTSGLTVIGPSKLITKVKKEPQKIMLFAENEK